MTRSLLHSLGRCGGEEGMSRLKKFEMRFGVDRGTVRKLARFDRRKLDRDFTRYGLGQLLLHAEDVAEIAVVALCPECLVGARGNELNVHTYTIAHEKSRAFEHDIHVQLARDFGQPLVATLLAHD